MSTTPLTGGYACVDTSGQWGLAVRFFTRSIYDHCFIIINAELGVILEADPGGARLSVLDRYKGCKIACSTDVIPAASPRSLILAAKKFVGIPYGFLDIAYLGLELNGIKPKWLLHEVLRTDQMICSQLVAQFGADSGVDWRCGQADPQFVTPGMLAQRT
jgi:hypothetical protein